MWYHENVFTPSRLDVEYVRALSLKHKKAQTTVTYNASYVRVTSWTHPLVDVVKANVDVAFIASTTHPSKHSQSNLPEIELNFLPQQISDQNPGRGKNGKQCT
ncbi:hypothetical protein V6N13_082623 [Hibiscus sabdariffa]